jgi:hypothetical protein
VSTTQTEYENVVPEAWLPNGEDERLHVPEGDDEWPWKDTWYICVRDEASDQTLNMHMTISDNRTPPVRVGVSVASGARSVTRVQRDEGLNTADYCGNSLAGVRMVDLTGRPGHEILWSGELPEVSFELSVKHKHHASLWDTMFPAYYAVGKMGQLYHHYEAVLEVSGWVQWKGEGRRLFDGVGWRDRGWGRRKTEKMFNTGYDLIGGILPDDSVFSLIALRSHEVSRDAPMPIAGWRSDTRTLVPATGGRYYKDSMAWPMELELDFLDGYRIDAHFVKRSTTIPGAWHDAEPEASGMAHNIRDYWAVFETADGRPFTMFSNHGYIHKVDVFRDAEFRYALPPS